MVLRVLGEMPPKLLDFFHLFLSVVEYLSRRVTEAAQHMEHLSWWQEDHQDAS
jgi:hypothetical protein